MYENGGYSAVSLTVRATSTFDTARSGTATVAIPGTEEDFAIIFDVNIPMEITGPAISLGDRQKAPKELPCLTRNSSTLAA